MQREYAATDAALGAFIEQPDYPTLVLGATDLDVVLAFKMLQERDRRDARRIYLLFPFECDMPGHYLQQCLQSLEAQIAAENQARVEAGEVLWAELPLLCADPGQPPARRLKAAIEHVRTLVAQGVDIVWALMPSTVADTTGYRETVLPLLALNGFEAWMEGHRFCIRDDPARRFLLSPDQRESARHVLALDLDFSPEKTADTLVGAMNDAARPLAERMHAALQLAALDLAHDRLDRALEKYRLLYGWHRERHNPLGQALALGGVGDVATRSGQHADASRWYAHALDAAADSGNLGVTLNLLMASGESCLRLKQPARAVEYFELASRGADKLMFPHAAVDALEKLGVALLGARKTVEAARAWTEAKALCERFGCEHQRRSLLERLSALYGQAGLKTQAMAYEMEKGRSPVHRDSPNLAQSQGEKKREERR
ncbi:tetratricopeptide repeat protein [Paraburkholderia silviterrae]|uniref:Tetratricopeptide repeat protein n=1 Tax=Paraburkholderia silviterrae TaxID=2528715 RepID=A0A4R5M6Z0_9BURK|nr:tetratricopeptide repeat protein [Paraburkholderia silviterrae]TDG21948.1 tetratricopeptide repeat protein [Paraburkholderia silviterrae]